MDEERPALRRARSAVDDLFADTSVASHVTLTDLRALRDHIEILVEGLEMSQLEERR